MKDHDYNELIDEIERQHKKDKLMNLWNKFAIWIFLIIAIILLFTAFYNWNISRKNSIRMYYSEIYTKGRALLENGDLKEATKNFDEVIKDGIDQYRTMSRFALAGYWMKRKNYNKASKYFSDVSNDNEALPIYVAISKLNILQIEAKKLKKDVILPKIDLLIQEFPVIRHLALELKGFVLYKNKEYKQARDVFMQITKHGSDNATSKRAQSIIRFITVMHLKDE